MFRYFTYILLLVSFLACTEEEGMVRFVDSDVSIASYIASDARFSIFEEAIQSTGLSSVLNAYNPESPEGYTLFLPTDDAFEVYFASSDALFSSKQALFQDQHYLKQFVYHHLVLFPYSSNEFPYGAFSNETAEGSFLTLYPDIRQNQTVYIVNGVAEVDSTNIELTNGFVHEISCPLFPNDNSCYQYLSSLSDGTIFKAAIDSCGLQSLLELSYSVGSDSYLHTFSLMLESDEVFNKVGVSNVDDLKAYLNDGLPSTDPKSELYQFMAYHITDAPFYLNNITTGNINTQAQYPFRIDVGLDIVLNRGARVIDTTVVGSDTTIVDYISIVYDRSNINTKNATVHFIDYPLEVYSPPASVVYVDGEQDPYLNSLLKVTQDLYFSDPEKISTVWWDLGGNEILYRANKREDRNNYFIMEGNFAFSVKSEKLLPGRYMLSLAGNMSYSSDINHCMLRVAMEDKYFGKQLDFAAMANNLLGKNGCAQRKQAIAVVDIVEYRSYEFKVETVKPGLFEFFYFELEPYQE